MERCEATGKAICLSPNEATERVMDFKERLHRLRNGRRRKHRQGRPKQKRAYRCEHCDGFHLTSWNMPFRKREQNIAALRKLIVYGLQ